MEIPNPKFPADRQAGKIQINFNYQFPNLSRDFSMIYSYVIGLLGIIWLWVLALYHIRIMSLTLLYNNLRAVIPAPYQVRGKLQRESRLKGLDSPASSTGQAYQVRNDEIVKPFL
jgi:hypothetical protein